MLFAPDPLAEYAFRDDGTRVYPHNDDALLYRVLNDVLNEKLFGPSFTPRL